MTRVLRLGTRGSALAKAQSGQTAQALEAAHPGLKVELKVIRTSGDNLPSVSLPAFGGKGLFTKEIEDALLAGEIDFAVHSLKDLPTRFAEGLKLAAVTQRADVRDAWICPSGKRLEELPAGSKVGTGSPRRKVQVLAIRPDLEVVELRGNVDTRIRKIKEGQVAAGLLAAAGLERLGLSAEAHSFFSTDQILPAPGQGFLAIQCRENDAETAGLLAALQDATSRQEAEAERALLDGLGGGCQVPVAAYARLEGGRILLKALVAVADASRFIRMEESGSAGKSTGYALAEKMLKAGAGELLGMKQGDNGSRES
jgi:hydroxymethylbilane synthase